MAWMSNYIPHKEMDVHYLSMSLLQLNYNSKITPWCTEVGVSNLIQKSGNEYDIKLMMMCSSCSCQG